MLRYLIALVLIMVIAGSLFGLARLHSRLTQKLASGELALAGNSLVTRFYVPEEKPTSVPQPFKLSNDPGEFLQLFGQELRYYLPRSGELRSLRLDPAAIPPFASETLLRLPPNLKQLLWAPSGQAILAQTSTGWLYRPLSSSSSHNLDQAIKQLVYSPDGKQVAYLNFDLATNSGEIKVTFTDQLSASTLGGKILLQTRSPDWQLSWPAADHLELTLAQKTLLLDLATGNLKTSLSSPTSASLPSPLRFLWLGQAYLIQPDPLDGRLFANPVTAAE